MKYGTRSESRRWLSFISFRLFSQCLYSVIFLYFWILSLTMEVVNRRNNNCQKGSYFSNQTLIKYKLAERFDYVILMTCHFIDSSLMPVNYDVMTDSSKSVRFMKHKNFHFCCFQQKLHERNIFRHEK